MTDFVRAAAAMVLLALACGGRDDLDGRRTPVRGLPEPGAVWELPLAEREVFWDLGGWWWVEGDGVPPAVLGAQEEPVGREKAAGTRIDPEGHDDHSQSEGQGRQGQGIRIREAQQPYGDRGNRAFGNENRVVTER